MSISCNAVEDMFVLYHDNVLSRATKKQIHSHLSRCPSCRRFYYDMQHDVKNTKFADIRRNEERRNYPDGGSAFEKELEYSKVADMLRREKLRNAAIVCLTSVFAVASGIFLTFSFLKHGKEIKKIIKELKSKWTY